MQLSFTSQTILDSRGKPERIRKTIHLSGVLIATGQEAIRNAINALQAAYSKHGRDAGLYHDNGEPSPHFLQSRTSLTGVRVTSLEFPTGDGTEYATGRNFQITLQADYLPPVAAASNLGGSSGGGQNVASGGAATSFQETLQFVGSGGPRRIWRETLRGLPLGQIAAQRTICRAVQTGSATGLLGSPLAPPPLWPGLEVAEKREVQIIGPEREGPTLLNWGVAWSYEFESPRPLFGSPHRK